LQRTKRRWILTVVITLMLMLFGVMGAIASPRLDGHPLLLSPDLARSTAFLHFIASQIETLERSDAYLSEVIDEGESVENLLDQARRARVATEDALGVAAASEHEAAPPELESLSISLDAAAQAYVEAGRLTVLFVNTPTTENLAASVAGLESAQTLLMDVRDRWQRMTPR